MQRASASGRGFFCPSGKNWVFMLFWLTLGHFWCSVVTSVTFNSNLSNFEKNLWTKSKKIPNKSKISKHPTKSKKSEKKKKSQKTQKKSIKTKSENLKKRFKKSKKIFFFQKIWNFKKRKKNAEKNAILLVLTNEEISLRPELVSPPHFRIQGGSPER